MNLKKTERTLKKLHKIFQAISADPEDISRIERDLFLDYIRLLYDQAMELQVRNPYGAPGGTNPEIRQTVSTKGQKSRSDSKKSKGSKKVERGKDTPDMAQVSDPAPETVSLKKPAVDPVVAFDIPPMPEQEAERQAADPAPIQEVVDHGDYSPLFEPPSAREISDRLSLSPIKDIEKAMGINDRMQAIQVLFNGKSEDYRAAIHELNKFEDFEKAREYLSQEWIPTNDWMSEAKQEQAKHFIQLIYRKCT